VVDFQRLVADKQTLEAEATAVEGGDAGDAEKMKMAAAADEQKYVEATISDLLAVAGEGLRHCVIVSDPDLIAQEGELGPERVLDVRVVPDPAGKQERCLSISHVIWT
jgi:hypothetical protein